ncbi:BTAD domain-containing putative transcriptional regulator [Corallococcus silvisoli]|uniref:BTAD domain-containing putative transcriptional regulator n=1 Tax=Corallococcus silvisoli TaxID=2697031 RepID=UPI001377F2A8|nr:BTAD domain-containing putative transcriptional regulator [Corallococcus silvisoli]NBD12898.1 hypothetical protein [Corallococcus silvisoli]
MSERESTKLRELKESAHALYQRGRYAQCVETYAQLAKLLPRDANVRVRLAEACRRAGQRTQAISAYREAAQVLLSLGCESRARGALKAALELDPRDPVLQLEVVRLGQGAAPSTALEDEQLYCFDRLPPPTPPPARVRSVPPTPPPPFVLSAAQEPTLTDARPVAPSIRPVNLQGARGAAARTPGLGSGPGRDAVLPQPRPTGAAVSAPRSATETLARSVASAAAVAHTASKPSAKPSRAANDTGVQGSSSVAAPVDARERGHAPQKALPGAPLALPALPRSPPGALTSAAEPTTLVTKPALPPERPTVKVIALLNRAPEALPTPPPAAVPTSPPHASPQTEPPLAAPAYRPEMRRLAPNVVALRVSPHARWVIIRSDSDLQVTRSEALPEDPSAAY